MSRHPWHEYKPKVMCAACHHLHQVDRQWPEICYDCAQKIRQIDRYFESIAGIKIDMIHAGIPLGKRL